MSIETINSPCFNEFLPGETGISSTLHFLFPLGPTILAVASTAINAGTQSAAGEALHKFPAIVQRPCI